jgi:uncharacterized membrane protein
MKELSQPPIEPLSTLDADRYLWWWRASRVIQDYDMLGGHREVIDEFPFFSFLLGDLHPHVLGDSLLFAGDCRCVEYLPRRLARQDQSAGLRALHSAPAVFILRALVSAGWPSSTHGIFSPPPH